MSMMQGAGAALATVLVAVATSAQAPAGARDPIAHPLADTFHDCLEPVPESTGASGVTDAGQTVNLEVFLLLDAITKKRADVVMTRVAETYAPLDIELVIAGSKRLRLVGDPPRPGGTRPAASDHYLFDAMKKAMNGTRPEGTDVVHLLTGKDVYYLDGGEPA